MHDSQTDAYFFLKMLPKSFCMLPTEKLAGMLTHLQPFVS